MGPEFDMAAANVLGNGSKYKLWFPNYTVQSGRPVPFGAFLVFYVLRKQIKLEFHFH